MPKFHVVPLGAGSTGPTDTSAAGTTSSITLAATINSDPLWVATVDSASVQVSVPATGTPVGVLKIQRSNHPGDSGNWSTLGGDAPDTWDWTDWSGATANVSSATGSPFDFDLVKMTCRWIRLVYTRTSGTGTMAAYVSVKGPS